MERLNVKNVIFSNKGQESENYEEFVEIVNEKKINAIMVKAGDKIDIEKNVYVQVLWPLEGLEISENEINNLSIVFKLCYKEFSCLFTGDIEELAENEIIEFYRSTKSSEILKSLFETETYGTEKLEDITENAIENIANNKYTNILNSTVLKVAHHGSKSSSVEDFLELVNPQVALIGVGKNNLYGHPSSDVLTRLIDLRNTDL